MVDPLLERWERGEPSQPHIYEPGSLGPKAAGILLSDGGHTWNQVCGYDDAAES